MGWVDPWVRLGLVVSGSRIFIFSGLGCVWVDNIWTHRELWLPRPFVSLTDESEHYDSRLQSYNIDLNLTINTCSTLWSSLCEVRRTCFLSAEPVGGPTESDSANITITYYLIICSITYYFWLNLWYSQVSFFYRGLSVCTYINKVDLHRARLLLGWVTSCRPGKLASPSVRG